MDMDKLKGATWAGKPLDEQEHYVVLDYLDKSKPIEIHRPDCNFVRVLAWEQKDRTTPDYTSHLVIGTLQQALRRAEVLCTEEKHQGGWKKGDCCLSFKLKPLS